MWPPRMAPYAVSAMASMTPVPPNHGLRPCARRKFAIPLRAERNCHGGAGADENDKQEISRCPCNLMQCDRRDGFSPISSSTMEPPVKSNSHLARFFDAGREILEFL